jgi:hypothetical protein
VSKAAGLFLNLKVGKMEYIIVALGCFALGYIYRYGAKNELDIQIMSHLRKGKRVIVCVDDDATVFEMNGNRVRIAKAVVDFNYEPIELPSGASNESLNMEDSGPSESGNYNEAGLGD